MRISDKVKRVYLFRLLFNSHLVLFVCFLVESRRRLTDTLVWYRPRAKAWKDSGSSLALLSWILLCSLGWQLDRPHGIEMTTTHQSFLWSPPFLLLLLRNFAHSLLSFFLRWNNEETSNLTTSLVVTLSQLVTHGENHQWWMAIVVKTHLSTGCLVIRQTIPSKTAMSCWVVVYDRDAQGPVEERVSSGRFMSQ